MDPISQGALGAACGQCASGSRIIVPATVAGCLSGMAADMDILIRSGSDPLLFLEFHRHFTHSLIFIPFGALLCALLLHLVLKRHMSFRLCFLACLAGYASHGLLDACTSYGTMLLWPFSDARIAWNNVSVIDPLFTVPAGAFVLLAVKRRKKSYAAFGLIWAILYLTVGYAQMLRALDTGQLLAESRGHQPARARAMPSIGNLWLWRHIYEYDGRIYADAVRVLLNETTFEGSSLRKFSVDSSYHRLSPDSTQAADLARFAHFADGYLGISEADEYRIVDLRYSALPNEVSGIWSIVVDPIAEPTRHVRFDTHRTNEPGQGSKLMRMLFSAP